MKFTYAGGFIYFSRQFLSFKSLELKFVLEVFRRIILPLSPRSLQKSKPLQQQACQALRNAILSGELSPGQRLVETQLAQQLEVSRTPIQEAIRLLQHENLATSDRTGVMRVAIVSVTDAVQLYNCRIALEQL